VAAKEVGARRHARPVRRACVQKSTQRHPPLLAADAGLTAEARDIAVILLVLQLPSVGDLAHLVQGKEVVKKRTLD
jgi:hypothetical protein